MVYIALQSHIHYSYASGWVSNGSNNSNDSSIQEGGKHVMQLLPSLTIECEYISISSCTADLRCYNQLLLLQIFSLSFPLVAQTSYPPFQQQKKKRKKWKWACYAKICTFIVNIEISFHCGSKKMCSCSKAMSIVIFFDNYCIVLF